MPLANNQLVQSGTDWVIGVKPPAQSGQPTGVPNPYGAGARAFEPNTQIYDPSNDPLMAGSEVQLTGESAVDKAAAAKAAQTATAAPSVIPQSGGTPGASGSVLSFINAAKSLLGKPYVWGGTTASGVDCSGLLYYAFNQAGVKMPRYRASDYGRMGQQVAAAQALPGDIVYWDEPGSTDHVGIYLGGGMVLNSPHTGTVVQIDKVWGDPTYRRIISDNGFGQMATSSGGSVLSYNGQFAGQAFLSPQPHVIGVSSSVPTAALNEQNADTGFRNRAL